MSLKEADWKKALNHPENLALIAQKSGGIGEKLRLVEKYEQDFAREINKKTTTLLILGLKALQSQCTTVMQKFQTKLPTVCAYVKTIHQEAGARVKQVEKMAKEAEEGAELEAEQEQEAERKKRLQKEAKDTCDSARIAVMGRDNAQSVARVITDATHKFETIQRELPGIKDAVAKLKAYKPAPTVLLSDMQRTYIQLLSAIRQRAQ